MFQEITNLFNTLACVCMLSAPVLNYKHNRIFLFNMSDRRCTSLGNNMKRRKVLIFETLLQKFYYHFKYLLLTSFLGWLSTPPDMGMLP